MGKDEASIEAEIQDKGLTAPRLTPQLIDAAIVDEHFHVFPGTTLTVCALTLRNGFIVTGESAAASPANFDADLGRKIARDNARNKIWALEGYLLRERLANPQIQAKMRAKVRVAAVTPYLGADGDVSQETLSFVFPSKEGSYPADGSDEDQQFARYTPNASLTMAIMNPALIGSFAVGDTLYIDFVPAS